MIELNATPKWQSMIVDKQSGNPQNKITTIDVAQTTSSYKATNNEKLTIILMSLLCSTIEDVDLTMITLKSKNETVKTQYIVKALITNIQNH